MKWSTLAWSAFVVAMVLNMAEVVIGKHVDVGELLGIACFSIGVEICERLNESRK